MSHLTWYYSKGMKNKMQYTFYEWQTCYVDEGHSDYFKTLKECLEQHKVSLKKLLDDKTIEFTLSKKNFDPDCLEEEEYAFVKNYKLDKILDRGSKVPQKYIKEFNNLI